MSKGPPTRARVNSPERIGREFGKALDKKIDQLNRQDAAERQFQREQEQRRRERRSAFKGAIVHDT